MNIGVKDKNFKPPKKVYCHGDRDLDRMSTKKLRADYKKLRDSYHELSNIWERSISWHKWLIRQQRLFKLKRIRTLKAHARVRVRHARKKQKRPTIIIKKKVVKTRPRRARLLTVVEPRKMSMKAIAKYGLILFALHRRLGVRIDHISLILLMGALKYFKYSDLKYARIKMGGTFTQNSMKSFTNKGIIQHISQSRAVKIYSLTPFGNILYNKCYNFIKRHIGHDIYKKRSQNYYELFKSRFDNEIEQNKNTE